MLLAPGFGVEFRGNFGSLNGTIAAEKFSMAGNASGTILGSIIAYGDTEFELLGSSEVTIDRSSGNGAPVGFKNPVRLDVVFTPAPGQKLDDSFGSPVRVEVSASPPGLLRAGAGVGTELTRELVLADDVPRGVLQVTAQAATCDVDAEHAACHLTRQDWGVPVTVGEGGATRLPLILLGVAAVLARRGLGSFAFIREQREQILVEPSGLPDLGSSLCQFGHRNRGMTPQLKRLLV